MNRIGTYQNNTTSGVNNYTAALSIAGLIALTLFAFYPCLDNEFTNWDDQEYILNNKMIKGFSIENIKQIFTSFFIGNYHPLAILSTSIDYSLGGLNPKIYHLTNVVLHLLNTLLAFRFILLLTTNQAVSFITALLWAIHPMHVESVAWVSERKDVLYTLFFFAASISYQNFIKSGKYSYYLFTIFLFLLSLLSKGQAVVLTPVLFLIDYVQRRNWSKKVLVEKIPFVLLSVVFGIVAIYAQDKSINMVEMGTYKSVFYGCSNFLIYTYKAFLPINLSAFYPYLLNSDGSVPLTVYLAPIACILVFILIYNLAKSDRIITFGVLFFMLTIFPVLQFIPVGRTMISERYTYVPYLGILLIVGHGFTGIRESKTAVLQKFKPYLNYILAAGILLLLISTRKRCEVWKDSVSLWSDVLQKYPDCRIALQSRGFAYMYININYQAALADFNKQVALDSTDAEALYNKGTALTAKEDYHTAIADYKKVLLLDSTYTLAYVNLGMVYIDKLSLFNEGIKISLRGLKLYPEHSLLNQNCGSGYYKLRRYPEAISYYSRALRSSPDIGLIWYLRSMCYATGEIANYKQAYQDAIKARQLGESVEENYLLKLQEAIKLYSADTNGKNSASNA